MERARGIGPPLQAWEARVLPLNYARIFGYWNIIPQAGRDFNEEIFSTEKTRIHFLPMLHLPLPGVKES